MEGTDLTVIVFSRDDAVELRGCLESLRASPPFPAQILVYDNASRDETAQVCAAFPGVERIAGDEEVGFGEGNDRALARAAAGRILFLNPDARANPDALADLARALDGSPDPLIVGLPLVHPDGRPQPSAFRLPEARRLFARPRPVAAPARGDLRDAGWVLGAALAGRTETFRSLGGFDPAFWSYGTDLELCARAGAAGVRVAVLGTIPLVHAGNTDWSPARRRRVGGALVRWVWRDRGRFAAELARVGLLASFLARTVSGRGGHRAEWLELAAWALSPLPRLVRADGPGFPAGAGARR